MARETQFAVSVFVKNTIYCGFWWIYLTLRRGLLYPFNYAGVGLTYYSTVWGEMQQFGENFANSFAASLISYLWAVIFCVLKCEQIVKFQGFVTKFKGKYSNLGMNVV